MKTLYLCGASNPEGVRLAQVVNRVMGRWERIVLLDDDASRHGQCILGVDVAGAFETLAGADPRTSEVANLVARTTKKRRAAGARIEAHGLPSASLVDPGVDTDGADLGLGLTIYEHSTICPAAVVGEGSVVFMNAVVGHGSRVGSHCVIGPGAVLNARIELAEGVYVGSNATLLPEVKVGAWATIGAGSVVLQDVPAAATVFGVPARILAMGEEKAFGSDAGQAGGPEHAASRPAAEIELAIMRVWCEVLGIAAVGIDVNFFDIGGNSLRALQIHARLQSTIRSDLAITDIFRFPTVRSFARHLGLSGPHGQDPDRITPEDRGAMRRRMLLSRRLVDS